VQLQSEHAPDRRLPAPHKTDQTEIMNAARLGHPFILRGIKGRHSKNYEHPARETLQIM
jgi:hypothetical protein